MAVTKSDRIYTPRAVAERLVALARLEPPGLTILEPHIGRGHLARVIAEHMSPGSSLFGYDTDAEAVEALRRQGYAVEAVDFLATDRTFDRIIASPPFTKGADFEHVRHMLGCLRAGGRLVSAMHARRARSEPAAGFLRETRAEVYALPAGCFGEAGSDVEAIVVAIDYGG